MYDGIFKPISHNNEIRPLLFLEAIADERGDPRVAIIQCKLTIRLYACEVPYTALRDMSTTQQ
jgi:hypothetical protein